MSNIFLTSEKSSKKLFSNIIKRTTKAITESITTERAYSGLTPEELKAAVKVDNILPKEGVGFDEVLNRVKEKILPNFLRTSSIDYMAHLHSPPLMESITSELILSTFNQSMDSWDQAPVATEIELEVVKKLCELYNMGNNSDGIFTSGGTQSNLMGITLARDWFCTTKLNHDVKLLGLPKEYNKLRIYTSSISHFSVEKSAHLLGLGYNAVVKVDVDENQKMDPEILRAQIVNDIEDGFMPMAVVATIGTTDYGSIDPLVELSEICSDFGLWLHGDAAYGSGLILSTKYSHRIDGIELCDSLTVDFHKMFLLPISCGAFLIKEEKNFEVLKLHADYLNREEDEEDGYTNLVGKSMQTTRRFDALKVWMIFQSQGLNNLSSIISKSVNNANFVYNVLQDDVEFTVAVKPAISSVVFRLNSDDETNKRVRRDLIHDHGIVIGQTVLDEKTYLKLTLLNPLLREEDLTKLLDLIKTLV